MAAGLLIHPIEVAPGVLLALHGAFPGRYPALFESAATGSTGRYDILFAYPGQRLTLERDGIVHTPSGSAASGDFLQLLDDAWRRERSECSQTGFPFVGGWLLYLGYELAGQIEPRLSLRKSVGPIAQAIRVPAAILHEHDSGRTYIVAEAQAAGLIEQMAADVASTGSAAVAPRHGALVLGDVAEDDPDRYRVAVARALGHIAAGDVYQANLSRAWTGTLADGVLPHDLYRRLRETNPGPFSGVAVLDDIAVVSSSPERLIQVRDGWVTTRPIAGTRPRGPDAAADRDLARELHAHPKERAEHVMLIDLERNDLGRICEAGTVHVEELMTIESYAHVHHIVSSVRGKLRAGATPGEVIAAVFPGGTITGCPKVRCMEIIAELEQAPRGAYTGSLGYLNRDGSMDMNILIRSIQVHGRELVLRAGAGIVADSIIEQELEETCAKARGVLRALAVNEQRANAGKAPAAAGRGTS
jgi:4-amino-4-deoxychorismate synthase (2-amino-4-deoxychorismate-forming) component I